MKVSTDDAIMIVLGRLREECHSILKKQDLNNLECCRDQALILIEILTMSTPPASFEPRIRALIADEELFPGFLPGYQRQLMLEIYPP